MRPGRAFGFRTLTWLRSDADLRDRLERLTFDTNRLVGPTPRSFIVSAYAESGARLSVLPTVQQEFRSVLTRFDMRLASRVVAGLRAQGQASGDEREADVVKAISTRAVERFMERLKSNEVWRFIEPSFRDRSATKGLADRLPDDCCSGRNAAKDKRILAETIVHGMNGIITGDKNSIEQDEVNQWARNAGVLRSREWDLVVKADPAFEQLCEGHDTGKTMLWWAAAAALPPVARDDRETVEEFATQLAKSEFTFAHAQILQGLDEERSPTRLFAKVRAERSDASRRIEEERRKSVREAAEEACWTWR